MANDQQYLQCKFCSFMVVVVPYTFQHFLKQFQQYFFFQNNYPTYNPLVNIEKREIIRSLDVESAAKKRDFRNLERKRIAKIRAENSDIQTNYQENNAGPSSTGLPVS